MSKIKLTGDSSGYVEISAPSAAGNNTLELPTSGSKIVVSDSSDNVNVAGIITATSFSGPLTGNVTGDLTSSGVSTVGQLNVGTGGTIITTTAGGLVGIGTDNPQRELDILGPSTDGTNLLIRTSGSNSAGLKMVPGPSGNEYEIQAVSSAAGTNPNSFIIYDRTNDAYRMVIDSSGRVMKPAQPGFFATSTSTNANQPGTGPEDDLGPRFNNTGHSGGFNTGNHYNTTTGVFTAPVSGKYYTFFNMRWETGQFVQNNYIRILISINGNNTFHIHQINGSNEAWGNYMAMSCSGVVSLSAGDTLRPRGGMNGGTAVGFWSESSWGAWLLG